MSCIAIQRLLASSTSLQAEEIRSLIQSDFDPRRVASEKQAAIVAMSIIEYAKTAGYPIVSLGGTIHIWNSTHYSKITLNDLETMKLRFAEAATWTRVDIAMSRFRKEFLKVLHSQADPKILFGENYNPLRGIPFLDGVLTIDPEGRGLFIDGHRETDLTLYCIPHKYKAGEVLNASWNKFVERALPNEEERAYVLASIANSIALDPLRAQKMLILLGAAGAGKSTLIEAISSLIGTTNTMRIDTLGQLTQEDSRHRMKLASSTLCICGDASDKLGNKDVLKQIVSKEEVTARMLYSEPMLIQPMASVLVATNEMGFSHALSDPGMARRLDVVMFTKTISESERDSELHHKLQKKNAQAAIGWSLAKALLRHTDSNGKRLVRPKGMVESLRMLKEDGDSLLSFFASIGLSAEQKGAPTVIHQNELLREFNAYCYENNFKAMSMRRLKSKLRSMSATMITCQGRKHKVRLYVEDNSLYRTKSNMYVTAE